MTLDQARIAGDRLNMARMACLRGRKIIEFDGRTVSFDLDLISAAHAALLREMARYCSELRRRRLAPALELPGSDHLKGEA